MKYADKLPDFSELLCFRLLVEGVKDYAIITLGPSGIVETNYRSAGKNPGNRDAYAG